MAAVQCTGFPGFPVNRAFWFCFLRVHGESFYQVWALTAADFIQYLI